MPIPSDYKDLLKLLNVHRVRYLIVGAYAVIYYTEPRYTKDIDIWIDPDIKNARKVYNALKEFGAPLKRINAEDFTCKNFVYQIGVEPVRVDIIMGIPGIEFDKAWRNRTTTYIDNIKVNIIGIDELIKSKKRAKRSIDLLDIQNLKLKKKIFKKRSL